MEQDNKTLKPQNDVKDTKAPNKVPPKVPPKAPPLKMA